MAHEDKIYKSIYVNILDGYTPFVYQNKKIYFKHFDIRDQVFLDTAYETQYQELKKSGASTEADILELCEKEGVWTSEHETLLKNKQEALKTLRLTEEKLVIDRDKKEVAAKIKVKEQEIWGLASEKAALLDKSCENIASSMASDLLFPYLFYYDAALKEKVFSEEQYDELHDDEIQDFLFDYNKATEHLNDKTIKHLALKPWFLNLFMFSGEQPHVFLGKPLCNYTVFQESLLSYASLYKGIFTNNQDIPKEVQNDPDRLISFDKNNRKGEKPNTEDYHGKRDIEALKASGQNKLRKKDVYRGRGLNVR